MWHEQPCTSQEAYDCGVDIEYPCYLWHEYDCSYDEEYDCGYDEEYDCSYDEEYDCGYEEWYECGGHENCDEWTGECSWEPEYCSQWISQTCTNHVSQTCTNHVSRTCTNHVSQTCWSYGTGTCSYHEDRTCYRDVTYACWIWGLDTCTTTQWVVDYVTEDYDCSYQTTRTFAPNPCGVCDGPTGGCDGCGGQLDACNACNGGATTCTIAGGGGGGALGPIPIEGFGAGTLGGWQPGHDEFTVTSLADSGPGTLREACNTNGQPRVIRFALSGTIVLQSPIAVPSNVTIDGRGRDVRLFGKGLRIESRNHVIITHIAIFGVQPGEDGIVIGHSEYVVIDHVWLYQMTTAEGTSLRVDEAIVVVDGSRKITIAWSKLEQWEKAILLGNGLPDSGVLDQQMTVTIHHNFFRATGRRHPEARYGLFHVYNNYLYDWQMLDRLGLARNVHGGSFGVKCRDNCRMILEQNVFAREDHTRNAGTQVEEASACQDGGAIEDGGQMIGYWNHAPIRFNVDCAAGSDFDVDYGYALEPASEALARRVAEQSGSVAATYPGGSPPGGIVDANEN